MDSKEILKKIYLQALENRKGSLTDKKSLTDKESLADQMEVAQESTLEATTETTLDATDATTEATTEATAETAQFRHIDMPDTQPENLNERERLMHDLMGVYRQKRQMIDDLPDRHRVLLEKLSRLVLGVQDTKQPPGGH